MEPDVTAIVVSYQTGPVLNDSLKALRGQSGLGEIILVDNGNPVGAIEQAIDETDKTQRGAEQFVPIRVLSGHGNIGFAAACNLGAETATSTYLLFVNPDAILPIDAVNGLRKRANGLTSPFLIAPKLVDSEGVEQRGSRRTVLTPWRAIVEAFFLYRLIPNIDRFNHHQRPCPKGLTRTDVISGACFFLSKDDYQSIGGMDEDYFLHVEDVDFCVRFTNAGGEIWFDPDVSVVHYQGSSQAPNAEVEAHKTKSLELYFRKHFGDQITSGGFMLLGAGLKAASFGRRLISGMR